MKGLDMKWPSYCLEHASGPSLCGFQLQLFIQALCDRHFNLYED